MTAPHGTVHVTALIALSVHVTALTALSVHVTALIALSVHVTALPALSVHVTALTALTKSQVKSSPPDLCFPFKAVETDLFTVLHYFALYIFSR